jgi:DNA invertase Pin-like site-specific DNA recombinase
MNFEGRSGAPGVRQPDARRKAVLYARVSSVEQEREGFSIPAQQRLLHEYAENHDLNIVEEFIDVETAKQAGRASFGRMLAFLEETPSVRIILVEKTDRLYRNFRDYVTLDDLHLEIHLVKEGEVLSGASRSHQKFIHGIKVLMAKNYIDNLSEETKKGMAEKAESGVFPHRAPVGYRNDKETRTIVVDPERAPYVRELFQLYSTGRYSLDDLYQRCLNDGFRMPGSASAIPRSKIEYLLKNPFYIGQFRWKKRLYKGAHELIVSRELFDKVQEVFASHGRDRGLYRVHEFAFGSLMRCGECGCTITAERHKGRYVYYRCTNYRRTCKQGFQREEALAEQFQRYVRGIQLPPRVAEWARDILKESLEEETDFHETAVERLEQDLARIKRDMNQAYRDRLDGRISEEFWGECSAQWETERQRITERLARHEKADSAYLDLGVRLVDVAGRAVELYEKYGLLERRGFLASILQDVTLKDGILRAEYRPAFRVLAQMAAEPTPPPNVRGGGSRSSKLTVWGG